MYSVENVGSVVAVNHYTGVNVYFGGSVQLYYTTLPTIAQLSWGRARKVDPLLNLLDW